eukprot:8823174-Pyramimonas_sp.AAC.1
MTGPVPPRVEAIRNQRNNALRYIAEFAREFLRAEFYSNDIPDGFTFQSFKCLKPSVVGAGDPNAPAALDSADFWRPQSYR